MQGFSIESKTSGISSSSTLWQDLKARYKSSNEVNMTPRSLGTKPEKMKNSEDLVRKVSNLAGQEASSNSDRNWRQGPHAEGGRIKKTRELTPGQGGRRLGRNGPRPAGSDRPAQPISEPSRPPLWPSRRTIYRPKAKSHASIHSSSAAEEQRREGHHLGEERVQLVD
jgi:hypothetical protein